MTKGTTVPPRPEPKAAFFKSEASEWVEFKPETLSSTGDLKDFLLSSLQMQHVAVLAGSGISLGKTVKGPSMYALWDHCVNSNPGTGAETRIINPTAKAIIDEIGYDLARDKEDIESLLSRCEAYLQIKPSTKVQEFVIASKVMILDKCSNFIDQSDENQLAAHRTFLHRLSRRRVRDSRLKLFTTNYDLCFETAAGKQGLVVLDGFSFTQPRYFDPLFFLFDIVRRPLSGEAVGTLLEGVFHLYKLHGSVNWSRLSEREIEQVEKPNPDAACLVYPAKGKYQQSYMQPHLELMSQYFSILREPNTCLIVIGFGFNDDHLSEPILAAVKTNPHLRLIIVNPSAKTRSEDTKPENKFWNVFYEIAKKGGDVSIINASFSEFAEIIPDLKSLTPAERLTREIKKVAKP